MFFPKLARLLSLLAIITLFAASCGGDTAIEASTETAEAAAPSRSSDQTEPTAVPPAAASEPTAVPATSVPEPTAVAAETEDTDAGQNTRGASNDDDTVVLESRAEAVAYIVSEGFVTGDAECIVDGAYQVFGTWDFAELDTDEDQDAELEEILDDCITVVPGPAAGSPAPGTDAELDVLWVACDGGSATACDDLYWDAPIDSDYEAFGLTCGGRAIDDCSDLLGDDSDDSAIEGPAVGSPAPGTDAELDVLWVACNEGSADACDDLFWQAPVDSDYEAYGLSCGGRTSSGFCSDLLGDDSDDSAIEGPAAGSPAPGTDAELDVLWVACNEGSADACDDLFWQAPVDSDYEAYGLSCGGRTSSGFCSDLLGDDSDDSAIEGPAAGSPAPGTDAELDVLWVACEGGSADACDDLFWQAPIDSDYEAFGLSCGGRTASGFCSDVLDG